MYKSEPTDIVVSLTEYYNNNINTSNVEPYKWSISGKGKISNIIIYNKSNKVHQN